MHKYRFVIFLSFYTLVNVGYGQLFDNQANTRLVHRGVQYIYNAQYDSANIFIDSVARVLPDHPAVPMMHALNILWSNMPLITIDSLFEPFQNYLLETVRLSTKMDDNKQQHPEAVFFELSARGFLAEFYADEDHYMKALQEATKAYDLIIKGFEYDDIMPEFLITSGVYNYFREKYPERNPFYKPFIWFLKSGDETLGINQLKEATKKAILTGPEASIYLAYIYLRYENEPKKAQQYLWKIVKSYPDNVYFKVKLLESLLPEGDFVRAPVTYIDQMLAVGRPYYDLAGYAFKGVYAERIDKNDTRAFDFYRMAIGASANIPGHGQYLKDLSMLGIGRIYKKQGQSSKSKYYLEQVYQDSEYEDLTAEARLLLKGL